MLPINTFETNQHFGIKPNAVTVTRYFSDIPTHLFQFLPPRVDGPGVLDLLCACVGLAVRAAECRGSWSLPKIAP